TNIMRVILSLCRLFFFSSRRRHTRSYGDWSSDVCSSDLIGLDESEGRRSRRRPLGAEELSKAPTPRQTPRRSWGHPEPRHERVRSEERRVGKEWRSRGCWCASNNISTSTERCIVLGHFAV